MFCIDVLVVRTGQIERITDLAARKERGFARARIEDLRMAAMKEEKASREGSIL